MKKLLIILVGLAAGSVGYKIYTQNKREELEVPREKELSHNDNDYIVYFDENEEALPVREELFV
jgi:hypothetical protein